jgi:hypothetical protein
MAVLWPHTKTHVVFEKQINKDYTLGCTSLKQHSHKQGRTFIKPCACKKVTLL